MKVRLFAILGLILSSLWACSPMTNLNMETNDTMSVLALGDSYTIGENVAEDKRWPVQLAAGLREQGIQIADPEIIARTGWTTADLLRTIKERGDLGKYDLVSLLIGANDQFQGLSIDGYRERFRELLTIAILAAGNRPEGVFVLSIPDWSYTPYGETVERPQVSAEIDAFNAIAREESETAGVHFFDVTPITRMPEYDETLFTDDGLHPSGKMYALWVDEIMPDVVRRIEGD